MSYRWSKEEEHLLHLLRATNTYAEIANEFAKRKDRDLPGFFIDRTSEAIRKKCVRDSITPDTCSDYKDDNLYTERIDQLAELQAAFKQRSVTRSVGITKPTRKILCISDIHFPHAHNEFLTKAITENADADIVVINGDMLDGYAFSSWEKHKRIAAISEYLMGFKLVQLLSENFPKVVITGGNHDIRPARALKTGGFGKDATQVLRPDLLARIANGEELDETGLLVKKHDFTNVHYDQHESWYVLVGKTIFVHPHGRGSSKPGFTVGRCLNYFLDRYSPDEFDSVVCGHTHKIYKGIINGKLLVEQGCLADVMHYAHSPKLAFLNPGMNGYAVMYQDAEGNTDFNSSGPVYLGWAMPPKKSIL